MAILKIRPRDLLVSRATATLQEIARLDTCDPAGEFARDRFCHLAELRAIEKEAERIGEDCKEIYYVAVSEMEIYESDREPEWHNEA
jgi:hypothetical protein